MPTGLTQLSRHDSSFPIDRGSLQETSFLTSTDFSFTSAVASQDASQATPCSAGEDEDLLSQFYEHSFAVHEDIQSSQVLDCGSTSDASDLTSFFDDGDGSSERHDASSPGQQASRTRLGNCLVGDVGGIPSAAYLQAITPQTMTVNLVVGIISVPPPRSIKTRRGGRTLGLIEMLVGDDTKAGFGINFWFSDLDQKASELQSEISQLRPQDIVLAKNIALSSFRGKVYGQSLRRGMTTLDLLYRNPVDASDKPGAFSARELECGENGNDQFSKLHRVKRWVMDFVAGGTIIPRAPNIPGLSRQLLEVQELPSDTQ